MTGCCANIVTQMPVELIEDGLLRKLFYRDTRRVGRWRVFMLIILRRCPSRFYTTGFYVNHFRSGRVAVQINLRRFLFAMTDNDVWREGNYPVDQGTDVTVERKVPVQSCEPCCERRRREGCDNFLRESLVDDDTYFDMVDDAGYYHGDIRTFMARNFPQPVIDLSILEADESSQFADVKEEAFPHCMLDDVVAQRLKIEYEACFIKAFSVAMASISARPQKSSYESTSSLCYRLNFEYNLDGKRNLREGALEQAAKARAAFVSSTLESPR